jgi:hypothetical protein
VLVSCSVTSSVERFVLLHQYFPEYVCSVSGVPRNFFRGFQQIQLRAEGRENGDLGAVAPGEGFHSICK